MAEQQFAVVEKSLVGGGDNPLYEGQSYGERGAVGPGPVAPSPGIELSNQFQRPAYPGPYDEPVDVTLSGGWVFNSGYNRVEIDTTPVSNARCEAVLSPAIALTAGDEVLISIYGDLRVGSLTVWHGTASVATIDAATWQAAAEDDGRVSWDHVVTAGNENAPLELRAASGAAVEGDFKAFVLRRDPWPDVYADFRAANPGSLTPIP